jgi:hypothetical protein
VNKPGVSYVVTTWDDETGEAEILEYDDGDRLVRRRLWTPWPEDRWDGPVVGEAVWFDPAGSELKRGPILREAPQPQTAA